MNIMSTIIVLIKSILYKSSVIVCCLFLISLLFDGLFKLSDYLYKKTQALFIKNSKFQNYNFIHKLLVINYRLYDTTRKILVNYQPFNCSKTKTNTYFKTTVLSYYTKKNIFVCFICLLISIIWTVISTYYQQIKTFLSTYFNEESINRIIEFLSTNKWNILILVLLLVMLYEVLKDKFTDTIILKIQDEKIEKIIDFHIKIIPICEELKEVLSKNIKQILDFPKTKGNFFLVQEAILYHYDWCELDYNNNEFVKRENNSYYISDNYVSNYCEMIEDTEVLERIKSEFNKFTSENNFYKTYSINRYIKGLNSFDIEWICNGVLDGNLLSKKEIHHICFDNFKDYDKMSANASIEKS